MMLSKFKSILLVMAICVCLIKLTDWEYGGLLMLDLNKAEVIQRATEKLVFQDGYDSTKFRTRILINKEAFFVKETPEEIEELLQRRREK